MTKPNMKITRKIPKSGTSFWLRQIKLRTCEAYPHYFGDVHLFRMQAKRIISGKPTREYAVKPQAQAPAEPKQTPDTAWFHRPRFNKPSLRLNWRTRTQPKKKV